MKLLSARVRRTSLCLVLSTWGTLACGSDAAPGAEGETGGTGSSSGGSFSVGGTGASSGGTSSSGGSSGSGASDGGSAGTGAQASTGGTSSAGGTSSTGGTSSAGGSAGDGAGGASGAGGAGGSGGVPNNGELTAFPGAQGFGRMATGARGGDVYHVTNLNDSGAGSLRDAISQPNRTIVFEVSGVIKIGSRLVFKSNQTIAGQTAPGGGITIYGNGTSFSGASNTIVRYVRFRMGKIGESGKDTVTVANGHDLIWDHCSLSWGRDGTFDLNQESGAELYNLTLQDSIVSQGLQTHSTGGLVNTTGTSIIRSLYIDNNSRNPKARGTLQFVNNVIYNWVVSGYILGDTSGRSDGAMIGNYLIAGPETNGGTLDSPTSAYNLYAVDNYYDSDKDGTLDGRLLGKGDFGSVTWHETPSVEYPEVEAMSAEDALDYVIEHAGTSKWRDQVDDYVMDELVSYGKKGKTISDETSLGLANAVGTIPGGTAPADADRDGMADAWETANGLDPSNADDRNDDRNGDGWTNLEEYINSLVP